jgi:hypothetical protein
MSATKINISNYLHQFQTSVLKWTRAMCAGEATKQNLKETKSRRSKSQGQLTYMYDTTSTQFSARGHESTVTENKETF